MTALRMTGPLTSNDVAVLGAGYAGLMAALRLARPKRQLRIVLVNASDRFLERVRLQEAIVADVDSHIPSIAAFVAGTTIEFICGPITSLDADRRRILILDGDQEREVAFDQAIYALGSNIDVDAVPGAAEHTYRLEAGDGPRSAAALRSRLRARAGQPVSVVSVGGAETGIEVASEIKTAWPAAQMTIISRSRCGGFKGPRVETVVRTELARLGVHLIDDESVAQVGPGELTTDTGRSIPCDICVWSGGLRSAAIAERAGLATDPRGRVLVDPNLRSVSHAHILAVGDAAHPIAPTGAPYRLSAFTALVSGAYAADMILAQRAKRQLRPFSFSTFGQGVAIGHRGVGFFSYPDDKQTLFIVRGRAARHIRNFFVWLVSYVLKLERKVPGFFVWPGRRRVSWHQANDAIHKVKLAQRFQKA